MSKAIDRIIDSLTPAEVEAIAERFMRQMRRYRNTMQCGDTTALQLNEIYDDVLAWTEDRVAKRVDRRLAA